jgi:hypothetical protein
MDVNGTRAAVERVFDPFQDRQGQVVATPRATADAMVARLMSFVTNHDGRARLLTAQDRDDLRAALERCPIMKQDGATLSVTLSPKNASPNAAQVNVTAF